MHGVGLGEWLGFGALQCSNVCQKARWLPQWKDNNYTAGMKLMRCRNNVQNSKNPQFCRVYPKPGVQNTTTIRGHFSHSHVYRMISFGKSHFQTLVSCTMVYQPFPDVSRLTQALQGSKSQSVHLCSPQTRCTKHLPLANLDYGRYQCRIESPIGNHGWHQCDKPRLVNSIQFRCANTLSLGIITKIQESPKSRSRAFWDFTFLHPYWARTMTILFGNILYLICGY